MTKLGHRVLAAPFLITAWLPSTAAAHVTATGLATITVDDREVAYRLSVVPSELPDAAAELLTQAMAGSRPAAERLGEAMRRAVTARVADAPCRPGRVAIQEADAGLKALLAYDMHCPMAAGRLVLGEDWTALFGEHYQTIATLRAPQGSGEFLLGPGSPPLTLDIGPPSPSGLGGFIRLGIEHILTGYDHLLFLFALLVGAGGFWRVLGIASVFTLAHSITLSLAVLGAVDAPAVLVEPLIALSIIWVAVENVLGSARLWRRFGITFVFGLVHGLGFADALKPLALAGWRLARALGGFNLGVELGQAMAICVIVPITVVIGRLAPAALIYRTASVAVASAGAYWLIERLHSW
jgi:hypothetical protein